ncbi:hypothetical protein AAFF_G00181530, partial [Aldrovandia affinis]
MACSLLPACLGTRTSPQTPDGESDHQHAGYRNNNCSFKPLHFCRARHRFCVWVQKTSLPVNLFLIQSASTKVAGIAFSENGFGVRDLTETNERPDNWETEHAPDVSDNSPFGLLASLSDSSP